MKLKISAVLASLLASATLNALPIHWDVELTAQPQQVFTLQRPRGETYELESVLKDHGKPFEPAITNACIYWQTNGMENLYWSAPASVSNNVLRASWLPSMDPGATTVRGYIGDPGHIYAAAFQFRFIASPGALPNELPLPQKVIDFAKVTVLNPPWSGGGGGGVDTNAVHEIVEPIIGAATNAQFSTVKTWANTIGNLRYVTSVNGRSPVYYPPITEIGYEGSWNGDICITAEDLDLPTFSKVGNVVFRPVSIIYFGGQGYYGAYFDSWSDIMRFADGQTLPTYIASGEWDTNTGTNRFARIGDIPPQPSTTTLRLYDETRDCYWIGNMVNGVLNWEVE